MTIVTESNGYTPSTTYSGSNVFNGMKIHTKSWPSGAKLTKITKHANVSNSTTPQLRASDGTSVLATGSAWSSNESTFDYTLTDNTDYYVGAVGDSSSSSFTWQNVQTFPVTSGTYVNWTASIGTFATTYPINITSIDITYTTDITISPSALTLSTTEASPTYLIDVPCLALSSGLTLQSVTLSGSNIPIYSHVVVGSGGVGSKILNRKYPYEEGLVFGTTKQTKNPVL